MEIEFNKAKYDKFKKSYNNAVANKQAEFEFYNQTFLTSYAKYVIEYLSTRFEKIK